MAGNPPPLSVATLYTGVFPMRTRVSTAVFLAVLLACNAPALAAPFAAKGLWGVVKSFGPTVRGTLVIDGRSKSWLAKIGGYLLEVRRQDDDLAFAVPDGRGTFRGTLENDGRKIVGQWIQPAGNLFHTAYATPVVLYRLEPHVWQGKVEPWRERLTLFLDVAAQPGDGKLSASFRNPEFNFGRNDPYTLHIHGNRATLTSTRNKSDTIPAEYQPDAETLVLHLNQLDEPLHLTRRNRDSAIAFYPETPATAGYAYKVPIREDDGWPTASLSAVGLEEKPLSALVEQILGTRYEGFHTPYIHSLLIARHGKLVLEDYFYGYTREDTHDMRSAGKTFTGVLVGLALAQGADFKLDTPVYSLFPQYRNLRHMDARKREMTVKDLLTMTSGLACNDDRSGSPGNEENMQMQHRQPDWYRYTLDLPMARTPGSEKAVYCTAGINLLGGIVRNTTHTSLPEFFYRYLGRPLEMRRYHMNLMPTGQAYMGGGIRMRPRDQLKLGQVYLDGGNWHGHRIVPGAWVKKSLRVYSHFGPGHGYGFAWHVIDLKSGGKPYRLYEAGGNGGQFVLIIPKLDMVIGFTAGNYSDYKTWYPFMMKLVPEYLIPAATGH